MGRNGNGTHPRRLRLAVVGLGYWGPNLLRIVADDPTIDLAWICDLQPEQTRRYGRRYPSARTTTDVDDVLDDPDVDGVVIATPVFTHEDLVSRSLRAGKHTFVEKPLAASTASAEGLVDLAADVDRVLMCGHTFLYSAPVRMVGDLIRRGALGNIFFVSSSRVNLGLHQRDVSVIWDLGPHDFSILLHWLGEVPTSVRAVGRDSVVAGIPDVAFITLSFPSGVIANVELSWLAPSKLRRTVVVGSEKMVVYDDTSSEPVRIFDHGVVYRDPQTFGEYHLSYRTGDIVSPELDSREPLQLELAEFADRIRSPNGSPPASLACDVVRIAEAAEQSLRTGGHCVPVAATVPAGAHA
jgi:predicted dehydrogenase